jgi:hypothetical protein
MLAGGALCMALKYKGQVVTYNWANLKKCDSKYLNFDLAADEVYFRGARTNLEHRGKHLAVYLQHQMKLHLAGLGIRKVYSIVTCENIASIKYHRKANRKLLRLYLYLALFKKYKRCIKLREYR